MNQDTNPTNKRGIETSTSTTTVANPDKGKTTCNTCERINTTQTVTSTNKITYPIRGSFIVKVTI
jgi:hypothetical protein